MSGDDDFLPSLNLGGDVLVPERQHAVQSDLQYSHTTQTQHISIITIIFIHVKMFTAKLSVLTPAALGMWAYLGSLPGNMGDSTSMGGGGTSADQQ